MSFVAWILLGLIAGTLGSRRRGEGATLDIFLGIAGALAGGLLFERAAATGVTGVNLWSLTVAGTGALMFLSLFHAIQRAAR